MTVRINKDAINLREKLSQLDKPSGLVGEELLRADTSADAREALNLEEHLFEDFESTGIDDNATSTKVTVSDSGLDVTGTVTADGLVVEKATSGSNVSVASLKNNGAGGSTKADLDFFAAYTKYATISGGYGASSPELDIKVGNTPSKAMTLKSGGDVSFYEDTGTTAKFVWDASAEVLTVDSRIKAGTTSDGVSIGYAAGKGEVLGVDTAGNGWNPLDIRAGSATQLYLSTGGNVGIGTSSPSAALDVVGDIKVSGGVYLGGTGTANKLDDYEEGTWTPAITGSTTVGSYSSVIAIGYYTKIGNLVTITGVFNGASGTGAGDLQLTNLPFSVVSDSVGVIQANLGLIYPTGTVDACLMGSGSTTLKVRCNKSDGSAYTHMAYPATASYVRFTLSYKTA